MAGNVLNFYDPLFYAQEALIVLEKELGLNKLCYEVRWCFNRIQSIEMLFNKWC